MKDRVIPIFYYITNFQSKFEGNVSNMRYEKSGLIIVSDIDMRTIREEGEDIDIIIPLNNRTVNLYLDDIPNYMESRLQFSMIKNMILRFCTIEENTLCTIHLLRSIDLHSSVVNFEVDYSNHYFEIKIKEYLVEIYVKKKELAF